MPEAAAAPLCKGRALSPPVSIAAPLCKGGAPAPPVSIKEIFG